MLAEDNLSAGHDVEVDGSLQGKLQDVQSSFLLLDFIDCPELAVVFKNFSDLAIDLEQAAVSRDFEESIEQSIDVAQVEKEQGTEPNEYLKKELG